MRKDNRLHLGTQREDRAVEAPFGRRHKAANRAAAFKSSHNVLGEDLAVERSALGVISKPSSMRALTLPAIAQVERPAAIADSEKKPFVRASARTHDQRRLASLYMCDVVSQEIGVEVIRRYVNWDWSQWITIEIAVREHGYPPFVLVNERLQRQFS